MCKYKLMWLLTKQTLLEKKRIAPYSRDATYESFLDAMERIEIRVEKDAEGEAARLGENKCRPGKKRGG